MASNIKVTFFGTGGSWPTPGRSMPSLAVQVDDIVNLFDCGEGTQKQVMKSKISFMRINNVFITHFHGDHFIGIIGMVQSMSFNGREEPLNIYGPPGAINIISNALNVGYYRLNFEVRVHELMVNQAYDFDKFILRAHKNDHTVPAYSYSLEEKDLIKIDGEKARELGIPSTRLEEVREKGIISMNGKTVRIEDIAIGIKKGRKIVYTGDTRPMESIKEFAKNADVLIHETTTDSSLEPKVNEFGHSSSRQAAEIAKGADAKRFYLFHFSPRVDDTSVLLNEARQIFRESYLSRELLEYEVPSHKEVEPLVS